MDFSNCSVEIKDFLSSILTVDNIKKYSILKAIIFNEDNTIWFIVNDLSSYVFHNFFHDLFALRHKVKLDLDFNVFDKDEVIFELLPDYAEIINIEERGI